MTEAGSHASQAGGRVLSIAKQISGSVGCASLAKKRDGGGY